MARCFGRGTSHLCQKTRLCHPERSRRVSCTPLEILQLRFAPFRMTTRAVFMSVCSLWMHDGLLLPDNLWGETQRLPSIRFKKNLNEIEVVK